MNEKADISIVIPAYNEARRLPPFLEEVISCCKSDKKSYEIVVVDDGSSDGTYKIASAYKSRFADLVVIKIRKNRGKGYAVRRGLLRATGKIRLFLDADGSVGAEEIGKNLPYLQKDGYDIFVGSRVLKDAESTLMAKWHRKLIGKIFNLLVGSFLNLKISDTQCGFKMFRDSTVSPLFSKSKIRGFGFDLEILSRTRELGYRIKEGPVSWHHVSGSKVNLIKDSVEMFINMLQIRKRALDKKRPPNKKRP